MTGYGPQRKYAAMQPDCRSWGNSGHKSEVVDWSVRSGLLPASVRAGEGMIDGVRQPVGSHCGTRGPAPGPQWTRQPRRPLCHGGGGPLVEPVRQRTLRPPLRGVTWASETCSVRGPSAGPPLAANIFSRSTAAARRSNSFFRNDRRLRRAVQFLFQ
jgi:hypothetical protein